MGRGEKSLLCDPGSELRLGGRDNRRAKIINGMKKKKEKNMCADRYELRLTIGGRNTNGYVSYVRRVPCWEQGWLVGNRGENRAR